MSGLFYSRYIPQANTGIDSKESSLVNKGISPPVESKKRKRAAHLGESDRGVLQSHSGKRLSLNAASQRGPNYAQESSTGSVATPAVKEPDAGLSSDGVHPQRRHRQPENFDATVEQTATKKKDKMKTRRQDYDPDDDREQSRASGVVNAKAEVGRKRKLDNDAANEKHKNIRSKFEKSINRNPHVGKDSQNGDDARSELPAIQAHGLEPLPQPTEVPDAPHSGVLAQPDWMAQPIVVESSSEVLFEELSLSASMVTALASKHYKKAFAIQTGVLPMLLPGPKHHSGDLCISAATGSGKTLAYVLPMIEDLRGKPVTLLRALVIVPTRELVTQVRESFEALIAGSGIKIGTAIGSRPLKDEQGSLIEKTQKYDPKGYRIRQNRLFEEEDIMDWDSNGYDDVQEDLDGLPDFTTEFTSAVDVLICTPGRLVDHLQKTKGFALDHIQWLIIDEADQLLDQDFQQWVDIVLPILRKEPERDPRTQRLRTIFHNRESRRVRKIILSATMTRDIGKLMTLDLRQPVLVVLTSNRGEINIPLQSIESAAIDTTRYELPEELNEASLPIDAREKPLYLVELLEMVGGLPPMFRTNRSTMADERQSYQEDDDLNENPYIPTSRRDLSSGLPDGEVASKALPSSYPSPKSVEAPLDTDLSATTTRGALIFISNNENAVRLTRLLSLLRPSWKDQIASLTKSTATSTGRKTLSAFRKGKLSVLIASDRASRGLDVAGLAHVINYDMPKSVKIYVHRVGRTARAGKPGTATTLIAHHEGRFFWNEIARSPGIVRSGDKKVTRLDGAKLGSFSDEDKKVYISALQSLGEEARGIMVGGEAEEP
ncbi:ATP-dependent RNA helicase dbp6 [Bachmanniomyces sp. S44760]|nr:ATP-dependent RNA helicase dbp6 [Bachmanniomyces sp. S44760]